jgi:hypothetical protein
MPTNWTPDLEFQQTEVLAKPGAGKRWFTDVPLVDNRITVVETSYQNGGLKETNRIIWDPTNLLEADEMTIRVGDSLLLAAAPIGNKSGKVNSGRMSIEVIGVTNYEAKVNSPVSHRFESVGVFEVVGTYIPAKGAPQSRSISVRVVGASFNGTPAVWLGKSRLWDCPNLPTEAVVQADPRLRCTQTNVLSGGGRQFSLAVDAAEARYVIARLGTNGPILAQTRVDGFRFYSSSEVYVDIVERISDGSQVVEMGMISSPVLPNVSFRLNIFVGGILFDDGTVNKEYRAEDFNELGFASVRFIRPASAQSSVCHHVKTYDGSVFLGSY